MVQINVTDDLISVQGHAEGEHGNNIACEAVTVLCNSIAASLTEITGQPEQVLEFGSGDFVLDREDLSAESGLLVRSFLLALEMVSEAYPDKIRMTKL